jgi:hypothetical protein
VRFGPDQQIKDTKNLQDMVNIGIKLDFREEILQLTSEAQEFYHSSNGITL